MRSPTLLSLTLMLGLSWFPAPWISSVSAQEPAVPPPPDLPGEPTAGSPEEAPPAAGEETVEPEVTIIQRREAVIEEYRQNGRITRIRVIPRWGRPYYLIPTNEAGVWRTEMDELAPVSPAQWLLFSW